MVGGLNVSKYKLAKRITVDIIPSEPISPDAVAGARYAFKYHNAENADTLALHHSALRELHKFADRQWIDFESYQGLNIYHDPDLQVNEWRVRKSDERIEALEDTKDGR